MSREFRPSWSMRAGAVVTATLGAWLIGRLAPLFYPFDVRLPLSIAGCIALTWFVERPRGYAWLGWAVDTAACCTAAYLLVR